jgi:uncharacterized protein (TIGR02996 family)
MPPTAKSDLLGLLAACKDSLDDTPRLVLADWLEEHGDGARAEFIRLQVRQASDRGAERDCDGPAVFARQAELRRTHAAGWLGPLAQVPGVSFERGLVRIRATALQLLGFRFADLPPECLAWVETLRLHDGREGLDELFGGPILPLFSRLDLHATAVSERGVRELVGSPLGTRLRWLSLGDNDLGPWGLRALARLPRGAQLTKLELWDVGATHAALAALLEGHGLTQLLELVLSSNRIGDAAVTLLIRSRRLPSLVHLDLDANRITDRGARLVLAWARRRHAEVTMEDNSVSEELLDTLAEIA